MPAVRKFEPLFYKINKFLEKTNACVRLQAEQIFSINIFWMHIFSILGVAFAIPFPCYFQKLQLLVVKKFWNNLAFYFYLYELKKCVSDF